MPKKKQKKRFLYRFGIIEGSEAVQPQPSPSEAPAGTQRISVQKFLNGLQHTMKDLPASTFPYRNRLLGAAHTTYSLAANMAADTLENQQTPIACGVGCDACCYYTDMDAVGLEFEEIIHYILNEMPLETRYTLWQQVSQEPNFTKHGHRPCPFLLRDSGNCGIYPVRPMGCRALLATKRCQLDVEEDTGLQETVRHFAEALKQQPISAGVMLFVQEQQRKGKGHVHLHDPQPGLLVKFKQLEPDRLERLFFLPEDEPPPNAT